jgi:hypothetical protein
MDNIVAWDDGVHAMCHAQPESDVQQPIIDSRQEHDESPVLDYRLNICTRT